MRILYCHGAIIGVRSFLSWSDNWGKDTLLLQGDNRGEDTLLSWSDNQGEVTSLSGSDNRGEVTSLLWGDNPGENTSLSIYTRVFGGLFSQVGVGFKSAALLLKVVQYNCG